LQYFLRVLNFNVLIFLRASRFQYFLTVYFFQYFLRYVSSIDGQWGSLVDPATQEWNGMIGMVQRGVSPKTG
jgi:hypothetical protein